MTASLILPYRGVWPKIHDSCFIAPNATIVGDVEIGAGTNIWYGAVIRGDVMPVRIGKNTNIQENVVIHVTTGGQGTHIGDGVTIGHQAMIHDCTIADYGYVGMQSCVLDMARVESEGFVAAGALVSPRKVVPSRQLWAGSPARFMRDLNDDDIKMIHWSWKHYAALGAEHKQACDTELSNKKAG